MKRLVILLGCLSLAGCVPHFKDLDSYNTLFRNQETTPPDKGDPYAFGGIAGATGGLVARQSYATDNNAPDPRDATETGKLGEIANTRTQVPGSLPGETGALPGTSAYPGFEDLPANFPNTSISGPGIQTGKSKLGDPKPDTRKPKS